MSRINPEKLWGIPGAAPKRIFQDKSRENFPGETIEENLPKFHEENTGRISEEDAWGTLRAIQRNSLEEILEVELLQTGRENSCKIFGATLV